MIKIIGLLLLFCSYFGCAGDMDKTQYIAIQEGKKLHPYARVIYKVFAERQEVVYGVEFPGKGRSQLYKLKRCIIRDLNNWEGEADHILLWKIKVEVVNGKFGQIGEGLVNVGWFEWHFAADSKQTDLQNILVVGLYILAALIIIVTIIFVLRGRRKES
jgi:hypothetical protein